MICSQQIGDVRDRQRVLRPEEFRGSGHAVRSDGTLRVLLFAGRCCRFGNVSVFFFERTDKFGEVSAIFCIKGTWRTTSPHQSSAMATT